MEDRLIDAIQAWLRSQPVGEDLSIDIEAINGLIVPADLMDDFDRTLQWLSAHLPKPQNLGHQEVLWGQATALAVLRTNMLDVRAYRAGHPLKVPARHFHTPHLKTMREMLRHYATVVEEQEDQRAIMRVKHWLSAR
jgi:hypothetical protein